MVSYLGKFNGLHRGRQDLRWSRQTLCLKNAPGPEKPRNVETDHFEIFNFNINKPMCMWNI